MQYSLSCPVDHSLFAPHLFIPKSRLTHTPALAVSACRHKASGRGMDTAQESEGETCAHSTHTATAKHGQSPNECAVRSADSESCRLVTPTLSSHCHVVIQDVVVFCLLFPVLYTLLSSRLIYSYPTSQIRFHFPFLSPLLVHVGDYGAAKAANGVSRRLLLLPWRPRAGGWV
jgi:hypothetical protein